MAVTTTTIEDLGEIGNNRGYLLSIATTGNYATGGYAIDVASNTRLNILLPEQAGGCVWRFDVATQKLVALFADYDAVADGVLIEYTNGAALATTLLAFALGE